MANKYKLIRPPYLLLCFFAIGFTVLYCGSEDPAENTSTAGANTEAECDNLGSGWVWIAATNTCIPVTPDATTAEDQDLGDTETQEGQVTGSGDQPVTDNNDTAPTPTPTSFIGSSSGGSSGSGSLTE